MCLKKVILALGLAKQMFECTHLVACLQLFAEKKWPHDTIKKLDLIRMVSACDTMEICAKDYIWQVAVNKFGANKTTTGK